MEPGPSRLPVQVLGENEALQQFFSGQDVGRVLDSCVPVDTSILEQYLSNDMDPNICMLPESPPDSSSEACSPAQFPDLNREQPYWGHQRPLQEEFQLPSQSVASTSCSFKDCNFDPNHRDMLTYNQLRHLGLTNTHLKPGTPPVLPVLPVPPRLGYFSQESRSQVYAPPTPASPPQAASDHRGPCAGPSMVPDLDAPGAPCLLGPRNVLHNDSPRSKKKRRRSESAEPSAGLDDGDVSFVSSSGNSVGGNGSNVGSCQLLTWEPYGSDRWSSVYDGSCQSTSPPAYHVDADKGFNYSTADEAVICQKKNHFQVTIHIGVAAEPQFIRTPTGAQQVDHFEIKVFGIKLEAPSQQVTIEQSQPDRSKKPFHPVRVSLPAGKITKVTLGRLHFGETTANNMRKKGKPNPDQRYFQMVVGLYAAVGEETFLLTAVVSERIIVRASNPGQFEMDGDALWQRGVVQDSVVCHGRVGINTDSPDEALVVCGNAKVMGNIMQPSDCRVKQNIQEVDSQQQLKRITQMRIVQFDYTPEFASTMGMDHTQQTGVIAQEVKELLPSAVKDVGDVTCSDGETIPNFMMVDKEQIFMENIGAVQHLSKLTDNLESRINDLEVWNRRLAKLKSLTGSLRSTGKTTSTNSTTAPTPSSDTWGSGVTAKDDWRQKSRLCARRRIFHVSVISLLATVALCTICVSALYLLNLKDKESGASPGDSNDTTGPLQTTPVAGTVSPTSPLGPWPPDVDFCELLYCETVYCCPAGGSTGLTRTTTRSGPEKNTDLKVETNEQLYQQLKSARDWTNTTIQSFTIKENQHPGRFVFRVPISPFVPVNMRLTLLMESTELLVVYLCGFDESASCSALLDRTSVTGSRYSTNTQGEHEWSLNVARHYQSSYYFRSTVAGQADCSTDHHYKGVLFTDYIFHFYRRCIN
ncbi:myelin regulatory factor-like protein [Cynoglossus semilaevis]|uniref:myelin regulatory factor-like protein n=1 Tax=Cynoglossus semilaevis TaxID=244447 RepID=UPI000D6297CC|nr:myelin regulatory factor-like protein [Cynoglossus semilaevis]